MAKQRKQERATLEAELKILEAEAQQLEWRLDESTREIQAASDPRAKIQKRAERQLLQVDQRELRKKITDERTRLAAADRVAELEQVEAGEDADQVLRQLCTLRTEAAVLAESLAQIRERAESERVTRGAGSLDPATRSKIAYLEERTAERQSAYRNQLTRLPDLWSREAIGIELEAARKLANELGVL